jgi:hypothetical protein
MATQTRPRTTTATPTGTADITPGQSGSIQSLPGASGAGDPFGVGTASDLFSAILSTINSTLDFLRFIAWIFYPRNILRAAEFLTGIILIIFGVHTAVQARGERLEGFTTSESALSRSGLGRVSRALASQQQERRDVEDANRSGPPATPPSKKEKKSTPRPSHAAPHRIRRDAKRLRYQREHRLARRRG